MPPGGRCVRWLALLIMALVSPAVAADPVEQWGVFELTLRGPADGNPFAEVPFTATFVQRDRRVTVDGFYDGDGVYKARFSPPAPGRWAYETRSDARPALGGQRGTFDAAGSSPGNRGPVTVQGTYHFAYADGSPYLQVGTTCYAWVHQPEALQRQTLETLAGSPFNKIRFCVFPKSYAYNRDEPASFAFQRRPDGTFDLARFDPAFWRHLEQRIADLRKLGIEADLILWHPYDRWGFAEMSKEEDDRYLRYAVARLAAFRNVWWSLANEFDLMAPGAMQNHRGNKAMADWDRFFQLLQKHDPYGRLRGIHNCRGFYDHAKPWVTHASIQHGDLAKVLDWRRQCRKPIVVDECGYEGNIPQGWGKLSPQEMVRRFWVGALRGGYVGHGETYLHPQEILWWSKGGTLHGQSPPRISFLKRLLSEARFHELEPQPDPAPGAYLSSRAGDFHLLYFARPAKGSMRLAGDRPYKLDLIDPWAMTVTPLGTAPAGDFAFAEARADRALRLVAYGPGEPLRPEFKAAADPAEGTAPLTVRFSAQGRGTFRWDFGDGASSTEASPAHTYREPGLYAATVTLTDERGLASARILDVVAEGDISRPIARVGFAEGETPGVKLHGRVQRGDDGAIVFPAAEPWGWASVGTRPLEGLEGLRSFTICGWVRPSSLKAGSGGNRIAFNLNGRSAGFDLVHLPDGRLRLSVNEWPDGVKNDSSPKLRVGEWTFFAVTYDATRAADNVRWYFGTAGRPAELDRATTYDAGPTGPGSGLLTVGNYNPTMHGHGLDRQFRGEIRAVQIFGSRVGSAGAFPLEQIRAQAGAR